GGGRAGRLARGRTDGPARGWVGRRCAGSAQLDAEIDRYAAREAVELDGRDRRAAQPGGALDLGEVDAAQVDVLEPRLGGVEPSDRRPARAEAGDGRASEVEVADHHAVEVEA